MKRTLNSKRAMLDFRHILNSVASENAGRLMGRARIANKLAKSLRGRARLRAYHVKTQALLELTTRFPERMCIVNDYKTPHFVLIKARQSRFGLHAPAFLFGMV